MTLDHLVEVAWIVASAVCTTSSAIVAVTGTPPANSPWAKVYKVIEVLALVVGKAKDGCKEAQEEHSKA